MSLRRVGDEAGERPGLQRRDAHRIADDAAREQVRMAVVVERDEFRRRAGRALEGDMDRGRILLPAMPRAETIFHRPGAATRLVARIPALRGRWRDLPVS